MYWKSWNDSAKKFTQHWRLPWRYTYRPLFTPLWDQREAAALTVWNNKFLTCLKGGRTHRLVTLLCPLIDALEKTVFIMQMYCPLIPTSTSLQRRPSAPQQRFWGRHLDLPLFVDVCGSLNTALFFTFKRVDSKICPAWGWFSEIFGTCLENTGQAACSGWSLLVLSDNYSHSNKVFTTKGRTRMQWYYVVFDFLK